MYIYFFYNRELKICVESGEDCMGYQIESQIKNISLAVNVTEQDKVLLMKVKNFSYIPKLPSPITNNSFWLHNLCFEVLTVNSHQWAKN